MAHTFGREVCVCVFFSVNKKTENAKRSLENKTDTYQRICAHDFNADWLAASTRVVGKWDLQFPLLCILFYSKN